MKLKANPGKSETRSRKLLAAFAASALIAASFPALAVDTALIKTPLGDIEFELLTEDAPNTVANFLQYIQSSKYYKSFVHRSEPGFIIQGGGYTYIGPNLAAGIIPFAPIDNEFKVSNTRGTVAMAKPDGNPDGARSQWFINLADNSATLDVDNGGYTVFGRVISGMDVADAIAQLPTINAGVYYPELPVINYVSGENLMEANLVMTDVSSSAVPNTLMEMNTGLNDAWYNPATSGQGFFITVFPNLGLVSLAWFTYDTELPADESAANLGSPGHRWMTALGTINGNTAVMNIEFASGGLFDEAAEITRTDPPGSDGTITLTFADCSTGTIIYNIPSISRQGTVPIQRVANDNVALCEALSAQ